MVRFLTMHSEKPEYVEAVVVEKGKIVFIGKQNEAQSQYANAEEIDFKGHTLLPGFIDPHSHFGMISNTMGQVDLNPEPVGEVKKIDDILQKLKNFKEENKIAEGEWIYGWGYDESQLSEIRHPSKNDIDKVLPNNPVYLQHTSGHMGVANSLALKELKLDEKSTSPQGANSSYLDHPIPV